MKRFMIFIENQWSGYEEEAAADNMGFKAFHIAVASLSEAKTIAMDHYYGKNPVNDVVIVDTKEDEPEVVFTASKDLINKATRDKVIKFAAQGEAHKDVVHEVLYGEIPYDNFKIMMDNDVPCNLQTQLIAQARLYHQKAFTTAVELLMEDY